MVDAALDRGSTAAEARVAPRRSAPTAVTVCRHLSAIFVTGPPLIGSSRRPSTSHRSSNRLIPQDIFEVAPDRFQVGTQIAVRVNGAAPCGVSMLMDKGCFLRIPAHPEN
jgi:hypothetical protein